MRRGRGDMKRVWFVILLLLTMVVSESTAFGASDRMRVAVVDFSNNVTGPESSQVEAVRRAITDCL
ncbi:MAG: hypothetical protein PWQ16_262 [bacterium]|nr:hypothetical protein [bacterium]